MATYLITGGAGFIGSNIAKALVAKGEKVKILDNFNTGKKDNIAEFIDEIEVIDGDFTNEKTVQSALKQVDVVFHQGAIPSVPKSIQNPIESNHANVSGTLQLLQGAVEARVSRFIYAASSSLMGIRKHCLNMNNCLATLCPPMRSANTQASFIVKFSITFMVWKPFRFATLMSLALVKTPIPNMQPLSQAL